MLYLAECYEKLGRTASAWAMYREAASAARAEGQPDRAKTGTARADRLEPLLSKLTIHVARETAPPGLAVLRNGQDVPTGAWGQPIPVDPGDQRIEANAPGYNAWAVTVNLPANAATMTVDVPALTAAPAAAAPPPAAVAAASETTAPAVVAAPPAAMAEPAPRAWQRPLGLVVGAVGVVGVGLGSYFGARAFSKKSSADELCVTKSGACANKEGVDFNDQAGDAATLANVFIMAVWRCWRVVPCCTSPRLQKSHCTWPCAVAVSSSEVRCDAASMALGWVVAAAGGGSAAEHEL